MMSLLKKIIISRGKRIMQLLAVVGIVVFGLLYFGRYQTAQAWLWTTHPYGTSGWQSSAMSSDGQVILIARYGSDLVVSTNGGTTWTANFGSGSLLKGAAMSSTGSRMVVSGGNNFIYTSSDYGATWTTQNPTPGAGQWGRVAMSSDGNTIAAALDSGSVWVGTYNGSVWSWTDTARSGNWVDVAISADGQTILAIDGSSTLSVSSNQGSSWSSVSNAGSHNWSGVALAQTSGDWFLVSSDGAMVKSANSGSSWSTLSNPGKIWAKIAVSYDGLKMLATVNTFSDYAYASIDGGTTWVAQTSAAAAGFSTRPAVSGDGSRAVMQQYFNIASVGDFLTRVTTSSASSIATTSAQINASLTASEYAPTIRGFEWGLTNSYGTTVQENGSFSSGSFSTSLTGLTCSTTYYYRAFATSAYGTVYGSGTSFTTLATNCLPTASTQSVSTKTHATATLPGTVTSIGAADVTIRGFQYGMDGSYGSTQSESGTFSTGAFTLDISSLTCNTLYHYRTFATNARGTGYGSDTTFTTNPCEPLVLTTAPATEITENSVVLPASIADTGIAVPTIRGFEYGLTSAYGTTVQETGTFGIGAFEQTVTGLDCGTTYHFRAFATSSIGPGYGGDTTFTTTVCSGENVSVSPITQTSGQVNWTTARAMTSKVEYGLTSSYGSTAWDVTNTTEYTPAGTPLDDATFGGTYTEENSDHFNVTISANGYVQTDHTGGGVLDDAVFAGTGYMGQAGATDTVYLQIDSVPSQREFSGTLDDLTFGGTMAYDVESLTITPNATDSDLVTPSASLDDATFSGTHDYFGDPANFGPNGGDTFTVTIDSTGIPGTIDTECADEGGTCSFSGEQTIAFGDLGEDFYFYGVFTDEVVCDAGNFGGDPLPGIFKSCYLVDTSGGGSGTDTFSWNSNPGGSSGSGVTIVANTPITLANGISVTFDNDTGHEIGDSWTYHIGRDSFSVTSAFWGGGYYSAIPGYVYTLPSGVTMEFENGTGHAGDENWSYVANVFGVDTFAWSSGSGSGALIPITAGIPQELDGTGGTTVTFENDTGHTTGCGSVACNWNTLTNQRDEWTFLIQDGGSDVITWSEDAESYANQVAGIVSTDPISLLRGITVSFENITGHTIGDSWDYTIDIATDTTHALNLTGLSPNTTYHYRIISVDENDLTYTSDDYTFTTLPVSSGGGGGGGSTGTQFGCTDPKALNYRRNVSSKPSMCIYTVTLAKPLAQTVPQAVNREPFSDSSAKSVEKILGSGQCHANLIVSDFMKQGDKNGKYSSYAGKTITQVNILQAHINRILAAQYKQASGPVDGIFGPLTKEGVKRLQTALNLVLKPQPILKIDGIVGPFTREAINNSCGQMN